MCAAHKRADGSLDWGKYSEESHYATAGKSPAAASASTAQAEAGKKGKRWEAAVRKEERRPQQTRPSGSQELDEEEEQQRLQVGLVYVIHRRRPVECLEKLSLKGRGGPSRSQELDEKEEQQRFQVCLSYVSDRERSV